MWSHMRAGVVPNEDAISAEPTDTAPCLMVDLTVNAVMLYITIDPGTGQLS